MTLRIVLTDGNGLSGLSGVFGSFLRSSNAQIQQAVTAANASAVASASSATQSDQSAQLSNASAQAAATSEANAGASESAAHTSEVNAGVSASSASDSADAASASAGAAAGSASAANVSAGNASASAILAQQWASQPSGLVNGVDYSARYYAAQAAMSAGSISYPILSGNGGTGRTSLTANSVLVGDGTNPVKQIGPGTNGQMLLGVTSGAPYWGNNPAINGAAIDNSIIGAVTPVAGSFTSLNATGATIKGTNPNLVLDDNPNGGYPEIIWKKNGVQQWGLYGDNASPSFYLIRYNASGSYVSTPWKIDWSTAVMTLEQRPTWAGFTPYDTGNTVAIANGGTGAVDAATARANLGLSVLASRNRVINGAMEIQQTAAAGYTTGTGGYGAVDCWKTANTSGAGTMTIGAVTAADENGFNKPYCYAQATVAMSSVTGTNNYLGLQTPLEGYNVYDLIGKQVTVSFTFRASANGLYAISLRDSASTYSCVQTINHTTGTTAKRYSVTFPAIPAGANIPMSNAVGLSLSFGYVNTGTYQAPATNTWYNTNYVCVAGCVNWGTTVNNAIWLTDVQLEEGDRATAFERLLYPLALAASQRYYCTTQTSVRGYGGASVNPAIDTPVYWPVTMRAPPTVAIGGNGGTLNTNTQSTASVDNRGCRYEISNFPGSGDTYAVGVQLTANARL